MRRTMKTAQQSLQDGGIPTAPACPVSPLRPFSYVLPSFSLFSFPHPHLSSASHLVLFSPERAQSLLSSVSLPRAPSCERQNQGTALQTQGKPLIVPLGCGAWCPSLRLECLWSRLSRSVLLWPAPSFEKTQICQEAKRQRVKEMVTFRVEKERTEHRSTWTSELLSSCLARCTVTEFSELTSSPVGLVSPRLCSHDQASHTA